MSDTSSEEEEDSLDLSQMNQLITSGNQPTASTKETKHTREVSLTDMATQLNDLKSHIKSLEHKIDYTSSHAATKSQKKLTNALDNKASQKSIGHSSQISWSKSTIGGIEEYHQKSGSKLRNSSKSLLKSSEKKHAGSQMKLSLLNSQVSGCASSYRRLSGYQGPSSGIRDSPTRDGICTTLNFNPPPASVL